MKPREYLPRLGRSLSWGARAMIAAWQSPDNSPGYALPSTPINFFQIGADRGDSTPNGTAHACVQAYGFAIGQCPVRHYIDTPKDGREYPDSPIAEVLAAPNEYQSISDVLLNLIASTLYTGSGYLAAQRRGGRVRAIHLLNPGPTEPRVDAETGAIWYYSTLEDVTGQAGAALIPSRDVAHLRLFTPLHPLIGVSPIAYATSALKIANTINSHSANYYANMSSPSGILTTDQELDPDTAKALRERWEEQTRGEKAGSTPILGWGMKWHQMTLSAADAELIEAWKMSSREIARCYGVPLLLVQLADASSYAEAREVIQAWRSAALGFMVRQIENTLGRFFGLSGSQGIEVDTEALLRLDFKSLVETLSGSQVHSMNESRAKLHLGEVEGGEVPRIQQQDVRVDSNPADQPAPPPPEPPPSQEAAAARKALVASTLREKFRRAA